MKAQRIQAEFIRKRDIQHAHYEKTNCELNFRLKQESVGK